MSSLPRFPVCIPSKGRASSCLTANLMRDHGIPFTLFVEDQDASAYADRYGRDAIRVLPFSNMGSVVPARNHCRRSMMDDGHAWHWQMDDDIRAMKRMDADGKWKTASPIDVMRELEDEVLQYENVGIAGVRSQAFAASAKAYAGRFATNKQVYCCVLVNHALDVWWRGKRAEDTDYSLQVLSMGWCTMLTMKTSIDQPASMSMSGGNTDTTYVGDGKLQCVRELQRRWGRLDIRLTRRFGEPRMNLGHIWRKFTTPLVRKTDA